MSRDDLGKTAAEIGKKIVSLIRRVKDAAIWEELEQLLDESRDLKHLAITLEDENHELRERLRFKGDDYEWRNPFWYHKDDPNDPLCAKCFSDQKEGRMGEPGRASFAHQRRCLVCGNVVPFTEAQPTHSSRPVTRGGTWM